MNKEFLKAYDFYKKQSSADIVLFHIDNGYIAFQDDAKVLAEIDGYSVIHDKTATYFWYDFHEDELLDILQKLVNDAELAVNIVEYRGRKGSFDIPKVNQIIQDIEDDY